jgi:hypothetical protein
MFVSSGRVGDESCSKMWTRLRLGVPIDEGGVDIVTGVGAWLARGAYGR